MLAEGFAVIGGGDDQRLSSIPQTVDQTSCLPIRLRDVIVISDGGRTAIGGVAVGRVRLEQMDPDEPARVPMLPDPGERLVHHDPSGAIVGEAAVAIARHPVAIGLESPDQSEAAIEWKRRDEPRRGEPRVGERLRQRRHRRIDADAVGAGAVSGRVASGHQARVRGQGDRRGCVGAIEAHAVGGEAIEGWRARRLVAVGADVIGAQGVDGQQEHVPHWRGRGGCRSAAAARQSQTSEHQDDRPHHANATSHLCPWLHEHGLDWDRTGGPPSADFW